MATALHFRPDLSLVKVEDCARSKTLTGEIEESEQYIEVWVDFKPQ